MYVYNYRGFDFFDRKVASIAVLADDNPSWRPDHFGYEVLGTRAGLWFPTAKILDDKDRWDWLESSPNLFAAVVMAHLKATETENDPEHRYRWKLYLIKRLYRMGYGRRDIVLLFEFIDWVMSMPEKLEDGLWNEIQELERENKMEYITSVQRIGHREGHRDGPLSELASGSGIPDFADRGPAWPDNESQRVRPAPNAWCRAKRHRTCRKHVGGYQSSHPFFSSHRTAVAMSPLRFGLIVNAPHRSFFFAYRQVPEKSEP